jgi:hypothetical protein
LIFVEAKAKREAEEKAKREAEEKRKREAEEKIKREAEERAQKEAAEKKKKEEEGTIRYTVVNILSKTSGRTERSSISDRKGNVVVEVSYLISSARKQKKESSKKHLKDQLCLVRLIFNTNTKTVEQRVQVAEAKVLELEQKLRESEERLQQALQRAQLVEEAAQGGWSGIH